MTGRYRRGWLTALVAAAGLVVATACDASISGHGSPPGDGGSSGTGADQGGGNDQPASGEVTRDEFATQSLVCQLFDDQRIIDLFGGSVDVSALHDDHMCEFRAHGATDFIDLFVHESDPATFDMDADATSITIAGHPGLADSVTISVSRGDDIDQPGCVQGENFYPGDVRHGRDLTEALIDTALGEFATG